MIYFLDEQERSRPRLGHRIRAARPAPSRPTPACTRIDHVAQTMNYEEMLTWLLFYTSIFDTRKRRWSTSSIRRGLVRSQVIENDGKALAPDAERRREPQHACRPLHRRELRLGRPASRLRDRRHLRDRRGSLHALGFEPLTIPANYYDDLEARFGLDAGSRRPAAARATSSTTATSTANTSSSTAAPSAKASSSRSSSGGGYRGYGAPNAPFRIAAQKRAIQQAHGAF